MLAIPFVNGEISLGEFYGHLKINHFQTNPLKIPMLDALMRVLVYELLTNIDATINNSIKIGMLDENIIVLNDNTSELLTANSTPFKPSNKETSDSEQYFWQIEYDYSTIILDNQNIKDITNVIFDYVKTL